MPIDVAYDADADAVYVYLAAGHRVRTVEFEDGALMVDYDDDGDVVGLEIVGPYQTLHRLGSAVERVGLLDTWGDVQKAIRRELTATATDPRRGTNQSGGST